MTYPNVSDDSYSQDRENVTYGRRLLRELEAEHGNPAEREAVVDANSSDQQLLQAALDQVGGQLTRERGHSIDRGFEQLVVPLLRRALDQGYVLSAVVVRLVANITIGLVQIGSDGNGSQSGRVDAIGSSSRR